MSALVPFPSRIRFVNADGTLTMEALKLLEILRDRVGATLGDTGADVFAPFLPDVVGTLPDIVQPLPTSDRATDVLLQVAPADMTPAEIVQQHAPYGPGTALQLVNYSFSLKDTAVAPGTYGSAANVAKITVDQQGRLTLAQSVPIQIAMSQVTGLGTMAGQNIGTNFSGSFTGKTVTVSNGIITSVV